MIGLAGVHGSGKTTLAKLYAEKHGCAFIATSTTEVFRRLGYRADDTSLDFGTRLTIQEAILAQLEADYRRAPADGKAITDRTPLDLMMYTLAEALQHAIKPEDEERLRVYVERCFLILNRHFTTIVIVQPGIPILDREGMFKGGTSAGYHEHLNSLILGLTVGERLRANHYYMPKRILNLEERIAALEKAVRRTQVSAAEASQDHAMTGMRLH